MANYQTLRMIDLRLREIFNVDEPFANINLMLVGDLLQLPPPMGRPGLQEARLFKAEVDLWRLFRLFELTINERQKTNPLGAMCSRLRVGKLTQEDMFNFKPPFLQIPNTNIDRKSFENSTWVYHTKKMLEPTTIGRP